MRDVGAPGQPAQMQFSTRAEGRPAQSGGLWNWWLRLTAPPGAVQYDMAPSPEARDRLRRAGLTSAVAPFVALAPFLLSAQASVDPITAAAIGLLLVIV